MQIKPLPVCPLLHHDFPDVGFSRDFQRRHDDDRVIAASFPVLLPVADFPVFDDLGHGGIRGGLDPPDPVSEGIFHAFPVETDRPDFRIHGNAVALFCKIGGHLVRNGDIVLLEFVSGKFCDGCAVHCVAISVDGLFFVSVRLVVNVLKGILVTLHREPDTARRISPGTVSPPHRPGGTAQQRFDFAVAPADTVEIGQTAEQLFHLRQKLPPP